MMWKAKDWSGTTCGCSETKFANCGFSMRAEGSVDECWLVIRSVEASADV